MTTSTRILIIGGVAAGPKAAARARRLDPEAEITIIERGKLLSYAGCGMPYFIEGKIKEIRDLVCTPAGVPRDAVFFDRVKGIRVLNQTLALAIDRQTKTVTVVKTDTNEHQVLPYDKLVLATGGLPVVPPIEGVNLHRVFRLNHPDDAIAIRQALTSGQVQRATIIGGGLIGLEVTEALAANGVKVSIVEMLDRVLPTMLDLEMSAFLTKYVRAKGVDVYTGEKVLRLEPDAEGNASRVVTDQRQIETDMVLLAVGVRPNVKLAQETGLEIGPSGGIAVNEYLQTSDPNIYAGGDCVESFHLVSGQKFHWPMGSAANKHGRVIGDNLVGGQTVFPGVVGTGVLKVLDYNVGKTGLTEQQARDLGYEAVTALAPSPDCSHFYPENKVILLKLVADAKTGKLLGAQAVGPGDGIKRIDVLATALRFGATVSQVGQLDLGYAPPYSTAIDLASHAANIIENKMRGLAKAISPLEVKTKLEQNEDFVWLDVRSPQEFEQVHIEDQRMKLIPLGKLRERIEELPQDQEIVVFCKVSLRGYEAQRMLEGAGRQNVRFMDGGIIAWPYDLANGR